MPEPDFVNSFNKQQRIQPNKPNMKTSSIAEQAINENLDLANKFDSWSKTINTISNELSEESFWPYEGEWDQGVELAVVSMLGKWEELNKALQRVVAQHDALVNKYIKCTKETSAGEYIINLARVND